MEQTRQHSRFASSYNFAVDREWVRAKKHGPWCKDLPHGTHIGAAPHVAVESGGRWWNHVLMGV